MDESFRYKFKAWDRELGMFWYSDRFLLFVNPLHFTTHSLDQAPFSINDLCIFTGTQDSEGQDLYVGDKMITPEGILAEIKDNPKSFGCYAIDKDNMIYSASSFNKMKMVDLMTREKYEEIKNTWEKLSDAERVNFIKNNPGFQFIIENDGPDCFFLYHENIDDGCLMFSGNVSAELKEASLFSLWEQ